MEQNKPIRAYIDKELTTLPQFEIMYGTAEIIFVRDEVGELIYIKDVKFDPIEIPEQSHRKDVELR